MMSKENLVQFLRDGVHHSDYSLFSGYIMNTNDPLILEWRSGDVVVGRFLLDLPEGMTRNEQLDYVKYAHEVVCYCEGVQTEVTQVLS